MTFDATSELYQVNWDTDALDENLEYRLEIWGVGFETWAERTALLAIKFPATDTILPLRPRWLFGWRDIDHSPNVASCDGSEAFCNINYGRNIPLKVRIEDFVLCPASRKCAVQFVAAGVDANLAAILGDGSESSARLFIPAQGGTDFPLGFEPCSLEETAAAKAFSAIPTFGPCLKTVTAGGVVPLTTPAVLSFCIHEDLDESQLAFPESQHDLLVVHHFNTAGSPTGEIRNMEAWPHVAAKCDAPTSGGFASNDAPRGFMELAQAAGKRILSLFGPEPLVALDLGGGGEGFKFDSFFMLGLPTKFEYENPGDGLQNGIAGDDEHTLRAKATDLNGNPVLNARVDWSVISSPGGDAAVVTSQVFTGPDGIAETTVTLSSVSGDNVFHASGLGIADDRGGGCTLFGGSPGAASCNGPRPTYDPFQPHTTALNGGVLIIPEDTRLEFTVHGCAPGEGTATPNGVLAEGEWDCALTKTFPVSLSGGATQATLMWMNDATRFYIAVRVPGSFPQNALRIDWDNSGDASPLLAEGGAYNTPRAAGDDIWEVLPQSVPPASDRFIDVGCSGSSQSGCGSADVPFSHPDAMQTVAGFTNTGGFTVYEMSHPLTTNDTCTTTGNKGCGALLTRPIDLQAAKDDSRGFFVTLRNGNGAQGNTQWPGFLRYMKVVIK